MKCPRCGLEDEVRLVKTLPNVLAHLVNQYFWPLRREYIGTPDKIFSVRYRCGACDLVFSTGDRRRRSQCCRHCGYSLVGNTSGVCPECGKPTTD